VIPKWGVRAKLKRRFVPNTISGGNVHKRAFI